MAFFVVGNSFRASLALSGRFPTSAAGSQFTFQPFTFWRGEAARSGG